MSDAQVEAVQEETTTQPDAVSQDTKAAPQTEQQTEKVAPAKPTLASQPAVEDEKTEEPAPPYWPADWRKTFASHVAAGDEKEASRVLKQLARYVDPSAIFAKTRELETKFTQGGLVKLPGKDAKPEEIAEFNKTLGVPEKPEGYLKDIKLENGAIIGDDDRPLVDSFAAAAHKVGAPPSAVNAALNWYFQNQESQAAALDEADETFEREARVELQNRHGHATQRYLNAIPTVFSMAKGGSDTSNDSSVIARVLGGRTADGKLIGNDPDIADWLIGLAREVNPIATVTEGGHQSGTSIDDEIKSIENRMRTDRAGYFKDTAAQSRLLELYEAREKHRARQWPDKTPTRVRTPRKRPRKASHTPFVKPPWLLLVALGVSRDTPSAQRKGTP